MHWWYLALAIAAEVVATSALKAAAGFTRPLPSVLVVLGYSIAFYCLSLSLKVVPVGVAYAIWSGVGTALIAVIGWLWLGQTLDLAALIGLALIVAGVAVMQIFSRSLGG
jgi:small multidrug resistance pump